MLPISKFEEIDSQLQSSIYTAGKKDKKLKRYSKTLTEQRKTVLTKIAEYIRSKDFKDAPTYMQIANLISSSYSETESETSKRKFEARARANVHKMRQSGLVEIINKKYGNKVVIPAAYKFLNENNDKDCFSLADYAPDYHEPDKIDKNCKFEKYKSTKEPSLVKGTIKSPFVMANKEEPGGPYRGFIKEWKTQHNMVKLKLRDALDFLRRSGEYAELNKTADELEYLKSCKKSLVDVEKEVDIELKLIDIFINAVHRDDINRLREVADNLTKLADEYEGDFHNLLMHEGKSYYFLYHAAKLDECSSFDELMGNIKIAEVYAEEVSKNHPIAEDRLFSADYLNYLKSLQYYHEGQNILPDAENDWNNAKLLFEKSLHYIKELLNSKNDDLKKYAGVTNIIIQSIILNNDAIFNEIDSAVKLREQAHKLLIDGVERFGERNDFKSYYYPISAYYYEDQSEIVDMQIQKLQEKDPEMDCDFLVEEKVSLLKMAIEYYEKATELYEDNTQKNYFNMRMLLAKSNLCSAKAKTVADYKEKADLHKISHGHIIVAIDVVRTNDFEEDWSIKSMEIDALLECIEYYQSLAKANIGDRLKIAEYYDKASEIYKQLAEMIPENKRAILKNSLCRKAHALLNKGLENKDEKHIKKAKATIQKMLKECSFEDCKECLTGIQELLDSSPTLKNIEQLEPSEIKCSLVLPFHFVSDE